MRSFTYFMRVTFMLYFFLLYTTMNAWAQSTDFSSFSLVTVHYQGPGGTTVTGAGYTIPSPYGSLWTLADEWGFQKTAPVFDEEVKDDGTGNKVWRFSNAVTSGSFSFQPNSPNSPLPAGETTASLWNDRGPIHSAPTGPGPRATAASKYFHGGFRFKSATGAAQPGLSINISPTARQSDRRNSFLSITDNGSTGFNIGFVGTGISGTFPATTTIASNLSYAAWHQVDIYIEFVDGLNADGSGNDIVLVYLDGVLVVVGTTWETFYRTATPTRPIGAVDALMFRASGTAAPGTLGNGIYFDDVVYNNTPLPTPGPVNVYSDATETTLLSNHFSIQAGVNAAVSGNSIRVDAGTYNENVLIDKNNLILHSTGGKAITTIKGMTTPGAGAVMVANGVNGVTIGQPNKGFTIIGFDGNGAIESAALYLLGAHTNITIEDNEIRADGDHGLLSNLNAAIDGIYIKGNMFTGKTFLGAAPEGCGFPNPPTMPSQFSLGNNYPRQLVTMGGGGGVTLSKNVYFLNNTITGTAGGFNADPACAAYGQGNNLVTIDVIGCTISGNIFNGVTTRFSNSLRTRGPGTSIYCNTFFNGGLGAACGNIFLGSATVLGGGASPNTLAGIAAANGFPGGGAYLTPDNAASYIIYRDVAQATAATTIPPLLGAGQVANAAATVLNCPVLNVNTGLTYATIQGAISSPFTLSGHTIQVGAGTYNENVVINKSLTLKGANYNVSCKGSRGAESVINGVLGSNSAAVSIESDGVTLNGFKITNPLGSFGVFAKGRNNTDVQYNVIDDVGNNISGQYPSYGIYMLRGSTAHTTNVNFSNNCVSNIRGGENSSLTGAAAKANNGSAVGIGAGDSEANFDISGLTIEGNIIDDISACISAFADGGKGAYGVIINVGAKPANIGKAVSPLVTNNEITDLEGLWAHGVGLEGETPGAMVLNNIIHGLTDHKGNTDAIGVLLESNDGAATVQINNNSLTNMAYAVVNLMPPAVNATCNWYGTTSHPAIALLVAGNLVYIPYLASGTDGSGLVGFQPTATCTGGIPQLNTTINGVTVNSINDGNDDLAAFSVCPGTNNILFNLYADANGLVHPNLRVYQTLTTSNVSVPFCNNCSATMAAFTGASGTAALINPAMAGTLVMRFKAWIDLNTDGNVDPGEPQGDWIEYTITVNPIPVLRITYNGVQVTANNDGTDDTGSFTVCNNTPDNVILTEMADLQLVSPSSLVKIQLVTVKTNVTIGTAPDGIIPLSNIASGIPGFRTASLINPAMNGTVEIRRRAFYDGNNNNQLDAGECPGDWIVYTVHVNGQAPTLINPLVNCSSLNQSGLNQCLAAGSTFNGASLIPAVAALYQDDHSGVTVTYTGATSGVGNTDCSWSFTYNYTISDACGNATNCSVTYSGGDQSIPVINTMNVSGDLGCNPVVVPPVFTGIDNCVGVFAPIVTTSGPSSSGGCNWSQTWNANYTDPCGNPASQVSITYTWRTASGVSLIAPADRFEPSCQTQAQIQTKYDNWLTTVVYGGGCNLVVTNDAPAAAPSACGGYVNVTWTANSSCEPVAIRSASFTVANAPGVILVPPADQFEGSCQTQAQIQTKYQNWLASVIYSGGCDLIVTNDAPLAAPSACGGVVTVKWTATSSCEPVITRSAIFSVANAPGVTLQAPPDKIEASCQTQAQIQTAYDTWLNGVFFSGGCGLIVTNDAPVAAPSACGGSVTVTWTAASVCEPTYTRTSTFTVIADNTAPTFTRPADITIYRNATCGYDASVAATGDVTDESDNCGVGQATFIDAVDATNPCAVIITRTWSLSDNCGNAAASQVQTITVQDNTPPSFTLPADITILFSGPNTYNASPAVTGNPTAVNDNCSGTVTVTYSDGTGPVQCGNSLVITRTWTATDACGNSSSQVQTITVTDNSTQYIIYAEKDVNFDEYHYIAGDVGVTAANGKADFKKNSVLDPYRITAKNIHVQLPSAVNNRTYSPATGGPTPTFYPYNGNTAGLSNINVNASGVLNGNWKDVTIKKGITVTVNGNNFGKFKIEEGATVTFTATDINMRELSVEKGKKNNSLTTVLFSNPAAVKIKDKVTIDDDTRVNVGGPIVTFYAGDNTGGDEKFEVKGENSQVTANIMVPVGKLHVHGGNDISRPTIMTGWFIIEKLDGHGKYVYWNKYDCVPAAPRGPVYTGTDKMVTPSLTRNGKFDVKVFPNPSVTDFRVQITSESDAPVRIRIFDVSGRTLQTISNATANSYLSIGSELRQGSYFVEIQQGTNRQTVKLLKME